MTAFKDYRVTSNYGWRTHPISKDKRFHSGIDIVKTHKAPIYAFMSGKVNFISTTTGYGNCVMILDSNGMGNLYAHLDSINVKVGQTIKKGTVVGRQGTTGNSTGSHLHFEVRRKSIDLLGYRTTAEDSTINPGDYLRGGAKDMLKVDGHLGAATIKRLQQFLGTPQDGKISAPSTMVSELQKFLNKYGK